MSDNEIPTVYNIFLEQLKGFREDFREYRRDSERKDEKFQVEVKEEFKSLRKHLSEEYVTKDQYSPVKRIVYGTVSTILTVVLLAILGLVVTGGEVPK